MKALVVRGRDYGNFDLLPPPKSEFDPGALAVGEGLYQRFFENYTEQAQRHERAFGNLTEAQAHAIRGELEARFGAEA